MLKAMRSAAVLVGLLLCSSPSFAEVQNVRVNGDVTVRGFFRSNLDLHDERSSQAGLDSENFFMSTTGINIGADLTENVSTFLRIVNERDWDSTSTAEAGNDIDLSQAYISLKELFYSPLTLRLGTQPIVWGRGFVLGSNLLPSVNSIGNDRNASITANEYTDFTAFDAIRATLDLSNVGGLTLPLTADYVHIKIDENDVGSADDVTLHGVNFSTQFDTAKAEMDVYYLNEREKNSATATNDNHGSTNTLGLRGSAQPSDATYVYGELAYQFGERGIDPAGVLAGGKQQAWATNLGAEYTLANLTSQPMLGGEWRFYSGTNLDDGAAGGWNPAAPGYFRTAIREFQTQSTVAGFYPNDQADVTTAQTNQHELAVYGSFSPIEDLVVSPRLAWFFLDEDAIPVAGAKGESYLGIEWDTQVLYDYTDDVQLGLLYALFAPGNVFRTPNDASAQQLVTTVSVKF